MSGNRRIFSRLETIFILLLGLALVVGLGLATMRFDIAQARQEFEAKADLVQQILTQRFNNADAVLTSLSGLYQGTEELSSSEFTFVSEELLKSYPYLRAIVFAKWVPKSERKAFELSMRQQGLPQYQVRDFFNPGGDGERSASTHLPVTFLEPMSPYTARYLGADLFGEPAISDAVYQAIGAGRSSSASTQHLGRGATSYVLAKATYFGNIAPLYPVERMQQVSGAFLLFLDPQAMIKDIETKYPGLGISLSYEADGAEGELTPLLEVPHTAPTQQMASPFPVLQTDRQIPVHDNGVSLGLSVALGRGDLRPWLYALIMLFVAALVVSVATLIGSRRLRRLERRASQEAVMLERERAEVTLQSIAEAVITTDTAHQINYMNPAAEQLTGWRKADARGHPFDEVVSLTKEENNDSGALSTFRLAQPDHSSVPVARTVSSLLDSEGDRLGTVVVLRDVSTERELTNQLAHQASHDALTGLPNRNLFEQRLSNALSQSRRDNTQVAVLCFDLDQFKLVNDSLGHAAGDRLLEQVSRALRDCVREHDTVARLGGDEFAAILTRITDWQEAASCAERALNTLCRAFDVGGSEVFITTSIGIAVSPQDGNERTTLLKNGDAACYHAKKQGRNNYQFYTDEMNAKTAERLQLEKHLRRALENEELAVHYQPQVDMMSGKLVGMEALVRWNNPELGNVSPVRFIPLAEETGMIGPIGEWVLREACTQNRRWRDAGFSKVRMSVNLSPRQFRLHNPVEIVERVLRETGLDSDGLALEITESAIMEDMEGGRETLRKLGTMGVQLAIDDFGTGYSSLGALKQFPLDSLKIDRSFVSDLASDSDDLELVSAIIAMAHNLRLKVVAEGVEDEEQIRLLAARGCDTVQGYYISKPIPADEMLAFMRPEFRLPMSVPGVEWDDDGNVVRHPRFRWTS